MKAIRFSICFCIALLFCQLPSFAKQYSIRLEAHILELEKIIETYSKKLSKQPPNDFQSFLLERDDRFKKALLKLQTSNPILYPLWMIVGFDGEITSETWQGYTPSLFLDTASLVWGLIGGLGSSIGIEILVCLFRKRKTPHSV